MAAAYAQVLRSLGVSFVVASRGTASAAAFSKKWHVPAGSGPLKSQLAALPFQPKAAIVAVNTTSLAEAASTLMEARIPRLLIEKPAGLDSESVSALANQAQMAGTEAYVGYNRRFYASVEAARAMITADGGAISIKFDFTEARRRIEALNKDPAELGGWFYANSTHVIDLAFFLGGLPSTLSAASWGGLSWHPSGAVFTGHGRTVDGCNYSYHANWLSPGRWGVEIMTPLRRLILQPIEQLSVQGEAGFATHPVSLEYSLDRDYKPGIFLQTKAFLDGASDPRLLTLAEHAKRIAVYDIIRSGGTLRAS